MRKSMCVVDTALVKELKPLGDTQIEIVQKLGISWNTWLKVRAGRPILVSVGKRLRSRVLQNAPHCEGFRRKFPCERSPGAVDLPRLEASLLRPATPADISSVSGRPRAAQAVF